MLLFARGSLFQQGHDIHIVNLTGELGGLLSLEGILVLRLLLMTFSNADANTDTATTLALHGTEVHTCRDIDSKAFGDGFLTVTSDNLLGALREDVVRDQHNPRSTLYAVERNKVEQLNQRTIAIIATRHIAIAGTFVGREHFRD